MQLKTIMEKKNVAKIIPNNYKKKTPKNWADDILYHNKLTKIVSCSVDVDVVE